MLIKNSAIILWIIICLSSIKCEKSKLDEDERVETVDKLREELQQLNKLPDTTPRILSNQTLIDINALKNEILKSPRINIEFSTNLTKMLKDAEHKKEPIVGVYIPSDEDDQFIEEKESNFQNNPKLNESFQPNDDEIKLLTKLKHSESNMHNLYRENLVIRSIQEQFAFKIGTNVEEWKTLLLEKEVALIGKSKNSIILAIGSEKIYEVVDEIPMNNTTLDAASIEALKLWDYEKNEIKNLIALSINGEIIWYELKDKKLIENNRWSIMKRIDRMSYFQHDGSDLMMITVIDDQNRAEVQFIEFNFSTKEFTLVQVFKLPNLPKSIACLDVGKDLIVAFTQESHIKIYRHQITKFEKGKFSLLKTIDTANVSVISGFRVGGYSYLAIGGDQPQILRYSNGDFEPQSILSQTFGNVEEFLPIPIKIYRDDMVLLVQHRIKFRSHSVIVVDALIWNGIAFESALSIPCKVIAKPDAAGFTCMLDFEREEGLLGASFILEEKNNSFYIVMPRHEAHSGLFRINYEIVEAEDPLIKEMEQIKRAIELINEMIDNENSLKEQIDEVFKSYINPKDDFDFENLEIDELNTDIIHFDGNVLLESERIEFLDTSYTREDFIANLDELEKTLLEDEEKLRQINADVNKIIRKNRQTENQNNLDDSQIYYFGPYVNNGQFDAKTIRILPQDEQPKNVRRQKREDIDSIGDKIMSNFQTERLIVEKINGIPVSDILFLENDGELHVPNNNIIFDESIHVENVSLTNDGQVNGVDLGREILAIDSKFFPKNLTFENVQIDHLEINKLNEIPVDIDSLRNITVDIQDKLPSLSAKIANMQQNLTIETINGIDWKELTSKLISKVSNTDVHNLTVNGNIWIVDDESELNIEKLNFLSFPNEYVLKAMGQESTVITGKKSFNGNLASSEIDTGGTINGISSFDMITLDQEQTISTETTFNVMEVNKKLEVHGTIAGQKLDEFLPNPTLEFSNEIPAACTFKELIVDGLVKIENSFNNNDLETILSDVVYEVDSNDEEEVSIEAPKIFNEIDVSEDVLIPSNFINNIKLDNIMTLNGEEIATFDKLFGKVLFSDLNIDGLFDGINVTDLDMNSIKTFGDQYIQTPILISKHVDASSLDIKHSLNKIPASNFYSVNEPIILPENMQVAIQNLTVSNLTLKDDIVGTGAFGNLDLNNFPLFHMSKSIEQNIQAPVSINSLITKNVFEGNSINDMSFNVFKEYMKGLKDFKKLLLSGNYKLDNLIIDGNVILESINEKDFNSIANNVIWLNKPNEIEAKIKFLDGIEINERLIIDGRINNKNFSDFINNWISSTENPIKINADKFINNVHVSSNLQLSTINEINFEDILKKSDIIESDKLNIHGIVKANKIIAKNYFNHESVKNFENIYKLNSSTGALTINADVKFNGNLKVKNLNTPFLNRDNTTEIFENMVKRDDPEIHIKGALSFEKDVMTEQGVHIDNFNDIDMQNLMANLIILRSSEINNIYSNITFMNDVFAPLVGLRGNLSTDLISTCNITEWIHHAKNINLNIFLPGKFKADSRMINASNIIIRKLNGIYFDHIFTLHTDQSFDYRFYVKDSVQVREPLIVTGKINERNIKIERDNTVMLNEKDQIIFTDLILPGANVVKGVTINGLVNSKDINKIATLDSSLLLDSSLAFSSLEAISLISEDRISGTNFTKWYENVVWKNGKDLQIINGNWKIEKILLNEDVIGNGLINKRSINEIEKNLKINVNAIQMIISNYSEGYPNMCKKLQYNAENFAQKSIYVLKYFEIDFKITELQKIFSYFAFQTDSKNYLLINTKCTTQIYEWNKFDEKFIRLASVETGVIYNWVKLESDTSKRGRGGVFIITNSKIKADGLCEHGGLNSWKFINDKLVHIKTISSDDDVVDLHVDSTNMNSFYALTNADYVINLNAFGVILQQWKLPTDSSLYRFLPSGLHYGLNLSNGRRIISINIKNNANSPFSRQRRFLYNVTKTDSTENDSVIFTLKRPEISFKDDRKNSIPTIPSKTIKTSSNQVDFITKVKKAGEVIRSSFNIKNETIDNLKSAVTKSKFDLKQTNPYSTNKLLFVINSPNITTFMQNISSTMKQRISSNNEFFDKWFKINDGNNTIDNSTDNTTDILTESETQTTTLPSVEITTSNEFTLTPRILMPHDEDELSLQQNSSSNENTSFVVNLENERLIHAVPIQGSGMSYMENNFIGEVTVLYVGVNNNKRPLYAVKKERDSFIKGNNFIEIYSDIIEGRVFQYIQCTNPSNIVALHFRDETLLAFIESHKEVQIFIYRGIEGFTFFRKISLPTEVFFMSSLVLPPKLNYKCDNHYLVMKTEKELIFMRVKIDGNCGIPKVKCNL
ncbi:hypothetical protein PVAND_013408 [Polypedilum vanderplanki]|uniref:Uncharacterized protein n=1 Tax=Polypedilum vanderplanki TaxID=319348 RepID=A0A9J6CQL1_POLVA|nr:hypothetical protein PVAND_013408 [Polypedilum vanderplanki]